MVRLLGRLCVDHGYSFLWPAGCDPFLAAPDGRIVYFKVDRIAPSLTDTPLAAGLLSNDAKRDASAERHPLKRVAAADDVAAMAAFLLSPDAAAITGQIVQVDNGMSAIR